MAAYGPRNYKYCDSKFTVNIDAETRELLRQVAKEEGRNLSTQTVYIVRHYLAGTTPLRSPPEGRIGNDELVEK
jgi:hypothetical protein